MLLGIKRAQNLLFAAIAIPLSSSQNWHHLHFVSDTTNKIHFRPSGLSIEVNQSASPLFYDLKETLTIKSLHARGELKGLPELVGHEEGLSKGDDFALRIGVVQEAEKAPNWFEKIFLPLWVKELIKIHPTRGVDQVYFLTIAQTWNEGFKRTHPKNKMLIEEVVKKQAGGGGHFYFEHHFDPPLKAIALWLQSDGDDTKSSFSVHLDTLAIETEP